MPDGRDEIQWSPRVPKWKLRRLYQTDALGILDETLLDDVGITLYSRCRDILTIRRAKMDRQVLCPRCDRAGREVFIPRRGGRDEALVCPECQWSIIWADYQRTFKRRQLNPGGAFPAFEIFVKAYKTAQTPRDKMLAIDRVIHEFHYSLRNDPDRPTRPAGVNLIVGNLEDVVPFLDELSGLTTTPEMRATHQAWRERYRSTFWPEIFETDDHKNETGVSSDEEHS